MLEALNEIIHLFVGKMAYMTNSKCRVLYFPQTFADLDPEITIKPAA